MYRSENSQWCHTSSIFWVDNSLFVVIWRLKVFIIIGLLQNTVTITSCSVSDWIVSAIHTPLTAVLSSASPGGTCYTVFVSPFRRFFNHIVATCRECEGAIFLPKWVVGRMPLSISNIPIITSTAKFPAAPSQILTCKSSTWAISGMTATKNIDFSLLFRASATSLIRLTLAISILRTCHWPDFLKCPCLQNARPVHDKFRKTNRNAHLGCMFQKTPLHRAALRNPHVSFNRNSAQLASLTVFVSSFPVH